MHSRERTMTLEGEQQQQQVQIHLQEQNNAIMTRRKLEALERTIEEIEALKIIYNETYDDDDDDDDDNDTCRSSFTVLSLDELQQAERMVDAFRRNDNEEIIGVKEEGNHDVRIYIPKLTVQLVLSIADKDTGTGTGPDDYDSSPVQAIIHFTLPPGYLLELDHEEDHTTSTCTHTPNPTPVIVSVVSLGTTCHTFSFPRSKRNELSIELNTKAMEFATSSSSSEAIMLLIQELQDVVLRMIEEEGEAEETEKSCTVVNNKAIHTNNNTSAATTSTMNNMNLSSTARDTDTEMNFSRRWIWVHHITKNSRINDIVREANDLSLGGYLKSGYPGVCVIEGPSYACDEFVQWIKGNKSRPGGFGRNWGHHVRGQIDYTITTSRRRSNDNSSNNNNNNNNKNINKEEETSTSEQKGFVNEFRHIGEDLAELSGLCRDVGKWMEDEFLTYVMQH